MPPLQLLIVQAMRAEAAPLIDGLGLGRAAPLHARMPMECYTGQRQGMGIALVISGQCPFFGVDSIGPPPAALLTHLAIDRFAPQLIINAGTAGGFAARGGRIGDVYLGYPRVCYHDQRIAIPGFKEYGQGGYPCHDARRLADRLGLKVGVVSTGSSLDHTERDLDALHGFQAVAKDMEAAAIGWVAQLHGIPFMPLKAITDVVDTARPTEEEFLENLHTASLTLTAQTLAVIDHIGANGL